MNPTEMATAASGTSGGPSNLSGGGGDERGSALRGNRRLALWLVSAAALMGVLAFASVPLYRVFCQVTGYGGTPSRGVLSESGRVGADAASVSGQSDAGGAPAPVTVRFSADVASDLPWSFAPEERNVSVRVGSQNLAWFSARNLSDRDLVGQATFNVTPDKAGKYFHKVQCFCFNEQPLEAGRAARMDVQYFVDPELLRDPETREIRTITLSYTFHYLRDLEPGAAGAAHAHGGNEHVHDDEHTHEH